MTEVLQEPYLFLLKETSPVFFICSTAAEHLQIQNHAYNIHTSPWSTHLFHIQSIVQTNLYLLNFIGTLLCWVLPFTCITMQWPPVPNTPQRRLTLPLLSPIPPSQHLKHQNIPFLHSIPTSRSDALLLWCPSVQSLWPRWHHSILSWITEES